MPSYRVRIEVGALRAGTTPEAVLPAGADAAAALTTVEARDVELRGGRARIVVRFTAADDVDAHLAARAVHGAVEALAHVGLPELTCRHGNRWVPVR
ncbi:hypothetical protein [Georgenia faecalis]|uniref:hypothetical protein n=1 Tax=Georgenia faecalis TaxID=2483799 RepID=UPI0013DF35A2|nr:hypothetical protein [Georgenia faecalis]